MSNDTAIVQSTPKIFHVVGNFASLAEALDAGKHKYRRGLAIEPAMIPHIVQPVDVRVRAIPLGRLVKTSELFSLYPRIVDPMTLATFGARFPSEQLEAPHFTVWQDQNGQFWCLFLSRIGSKRSVYADQDNPGGGWDGHFRVLVREL